MSASKTSTSSEVDGDRRRKTKKKKHSGDGTRETVESIAIAFVLAFLFKTFQAEAYVIPTGSMAPTLFGRHKEVNCEACGFEFELGASGEIDQSSGLLKERINYAVCGNCGFENNVRDAAVFNGDRILVNKQVPGFERFDVVVFKNPEEGHVNYIKRLVGLPGEVVRVRKGDVWVQQPNAEGFEIQRKDPYVQKDIQLTVYDDQHPARPLIEAGWPERWEPSERSTGDGHVGQWRPAENAWQPDRLTRSYHCEASEQTSWLRYRHFLPGAAAWNGREELQPTASLITDFCSFNSNASANAHGLYWVGDLTLNATVDVESIAEGSTALLELVDGPRLVQCEIDLTTGLATLTLQDSGNPDSVETLAQGRTPLDHADEFQISFANVDDRICLFVDGDLIEFDQPTTYVDSMLPEPTEKDLAPVGIAFANTAVTVSNLLLERDIYYRNDVIPFDHDDGAIQPNYSGMDTSEREVNDSGNRQLSALLDNPEAWARQYAEAVAIQLNNYGRFGEYALADDEYLMFGDNSAMSKDSRLFDYYARPLSGIYSHRYAVRRQDLIGKALFIFWPHGIPFMNDGEGFALRNHRMVPVSERSYQDVRDALGPHEYPSFRIPFYPDVQRMKKIR